MSATDPRAVFEDALAQMQRAHDALTVRPDDRDAWREWDAAVAAVRALHEPVRERAVERATRGRR